MGKCDSAIPQFGGDRNQWERVRRVTQDKKKVKLFDVVPTLSCQAKKLKYMTTDVSANDDRDKTLLI